jgi:TolB-like protein
MMNKLNKIRLFLFGTLSFVCIGNLHAQQAINLDEVIIQAAKDMEARLSAGAKLAVLNFTSTAEAFSDYVIEELSGALVMNRKVTVIERKSLDLVRKEMNLQLSGDVSDDSAQAIGKQLGAQAIVTGSLTNMGDTYRFRVKVINVETARIEAQFSYNLGNNQQVAFLLNGNQQNTPSAESALVPTAQQGKTTITGQLSDGTYTFNPRPVGTKGGIDDGGWLVKIVIRSGYMNLFLTNKAFGKGTKGGLAFGPPSTLTLQDLNNPSKRHNAIMDPRWDDETGSYIITFQNVTSSQLKYIETRPNPPWVIEEILLGDPD